MKEEHKFMLIGAGIGFILTFLVMSLMKQDKIDQLTISGDGGGFTLDLKSNDIADSVLLAKMWDSDFSKDGMIGWFKRKNYISLADNQAIGNKIKQLSPKDDLAKAILELERKQRGPFQILADSATISVPNYRVPIPPGEAYTWTKSILEGKTIEIADPEMRHRPLKLICRKGLGAKPENFKYGDLFFHVNEADFNALLGDESRTGAKIGKVYLTVVEE